MDWDDEDIMWNTVKLEEKIEELVKKENYPDGGHLRIEMLDYRGNSGFQIVDDQSKLEGAISELYARLLVGEDLIHMEWCIE